METAGYLDLELVPKDVKAVQDVGDGLRSSRKDVERLLEGHGVTVRKVDSAIESLSEFAEGFVSKAEVAAMREEREREISRLRIEHEARLEALESAEDWRLNPSVIVRISHIINELNGLTETGKNVLKVMSNLDPSVTFSEDQIALVINRSPSTAKQYLKQLSSLGWAKAVRDGFQNNIDRNLAKKLTEVQRPDQEPIPNVVIERCKKELQTFIRPF
ncbi:MAG: hypothetical protein QXZ06_04215 [Candidatus Jordarchaeales archaeon]